ncbi:lipopolysaccharide biosynthesis protein [Pedobacter chinensis]|uniref:Lipopolysaccharide biosynthesis protein n=1 Tax=Pedobacter chinensis TaxID=2282421 RepID=A0A369PNZ9_9SPHI|nr:oligosaccharide flippase family protein [Pedobacter chinensis]RDC54264.1 lipopolysaccharide biosynthesis protein [Pedobacter chinensis]
MSDSKRIAKNTMLLYIRMFLTMGVSLYTSRVVLNALGIQDYGIYSVVGGVVTLFTFFNSAMSSATQRFLAMDVGKKDHVGLRKTFNSALVIHIGIALLVLLIAETIGLWFVNYKLNLPVGRINEANFVYQFSIMASMIGITQVPFNALIIVRERMNVFAVISIIEVILKLLIVYLLYLSSYDKLETYAVLLFITPLIISTIYKIYCLKNFKESAFRFYKDKTFYKTLISYSGWNLFGNIAYVAKGQGTNMLLNVFFGTVVNAAYGIMNQVQTAVNSFVSNFQMAVNPQIYKNYAQGNMQQMHKLMIQSSKFSYYLMFVLVCPIIFNVHFILIWWLKNPPQYTAILVNLALINLLIECLSRPLATGSLATGKIKWYQITVGSILFLNLPLSYLAFKIAKDPSLFLYITIVLSLITLVIRLMFLKKMVALGLSIFAKEVFLPILYITCLCVGLLYAFNFFAGQSDTFFKLIWESLVIVTVTLTVIFSLGFKKSEKAMVYNLIRKKLG